MYPAVDRAFKHVITSESSGDGGDLSPYRMVKLKSPRISSQSAATLRIFLMNSWWPELGAYTPHILIGGKWGVWTVAVIHHPSLSVCGLEKCTPGCKGIRAHPRCFCMHEAKIALGMRAHGLSVGVKCVSNTKAKSANELRRCCRKQHGLSGNS